MDWNKRRMLEMAGIIHRSDTDTEAGLLSEGSKETRERNKLARRSMMYGQDNPELARLRQTMPNKDDVIYDYDLFWNDETGSWWCNVVKYGKYDAFDTGCGDPHDPWRAALASEGESSHWQQMTANSNFAGAWTNESLNLKETKELEKYHMLKLAGLLTEGEDEEPADDGGDDGGDDLFGDDGGDGGDDLFGDDSGGDMGGDSGGGGGDGATESEVERLPPSSLSNKDIAQFGSSTFMDLDGEMAQIFNKHIKSASFGAQELEGAPGKAMEDEEATPAKEVPDEIEDGEDEEAPDKDEGTEETDDKKEKQEESRWLLTRDRWLISEAFRLLNEGEDEGGEAEDEVLPEEFNMDGFVLDFINKLVQDPTHSEFSELEKDMWGRWYNMARQTILNNLTETEKMDFEDLLEERLREMDGTAYQAVADYLFGESEDAVSYEVGSADIPVAVGATGGGGGGGGL